MTVAELALAIRRVEGVAPNRGATLDEVIATETRLGSPLPSELKQLVKVMDGCEGETPPNQSWTTLWPLRRWRAVGESGSTGDYAQAIVFADYCQESWWYAFESSSEGQVGF